jgi:RNA polymerase sigma factor (sigma-70 family)
MGYNMGGGHGKQTRSTLEIPVPKYENPEWKDVTFLQTADFERLLKKAAEKLKEPEWRAPLGFIYLTLRERRPSGVVEGKNPQAWIFKTVRGALRKYYRSEQPDRRRSRRELEDREVKTEDKELPELVRGALGGLPPRERELIKKKHGYECARATLADISKKRGVSEPTARKRIRAAEDRFRNELKKVDSIREDYCDEHGRTRLPRSRPRFT